MSNINHYMTVNQAAASLGLSHSRILQLIKDGRLPASKFGGNYVLDPADVAEYGRTRRGPGRPKTLKT